jgi:hypothetical protein
MPRQISVFSENKPGKINRITAILEEKSINIRAITISDSGDYGIIKLLLDKPDEGCTALKDAGIAATLKDIVAVKVSDRPGGLRKVASILADNNINVEDAYGFTIRNGDEAVFVFQVDNVPRTEKILSEADYPILQDNELYLL